MPRELELMRQIVRQLFSSHSTSWFVVYLRIADVVDYD